MIHKMSDNHAAGFRPSHFAALSECIHHTSKEGDSEACLRGTDTHAEIAGWLEVLQEGSQAVQNDKLSPPAKYAISVVAEYLKDGWRIHAIEAPIALIDDMGEIITHGTIDLVLHRPDDLHIGQWLIVDWKTGDKSDYSEQIGAYIMAWWDASGHVLGSVEGLVAYVDLRETQSVSPSYQLSSKRVLGLYEKWKTRENQPYVINEYCSWCAVRATCPEWDKQATTALDKVNYLACVNKTTGLPQGGNLVPAAVTGLKNDPVALEEFVLAWERCKTLVDDDWALKAALKAHMETGFKAAHHILVMVKDKTEITKSIDPEQYLEHVAHHIGYMQASPAITVDPEKAQEAWRAFYGYGEDAKFPVDIKETITEKPGYSYIRAKGKLGVGDARKKRKELE